MSTILNITRKVNTDPAERHFQILVESHAVSIYPVELCMGFVSQVFFFVYRVCKAQNPRLAFLMKMSPVGFPLDSGGRRASKVEERKKKAVKTHTHTQNNPSCRQEKWRLRGPKKPPVEFVKSEKQRVVSRSVMGGSSIFLRKCQILQFT